MGGVVAQLLAQLPDINVQILRVLDMRRAPDVFGQLALRDDLAGTLHLEAQQIVLLGQQFHWLPTLVHLTLQD